MATALEQTHWQTAFRAALMLVRAPDVAEDIAQETILRAAKHPTSLDNPSAWITRVAQNLARDHLRSAWRRQRVNDGDLAQHQVDTPPPPEQAPPNEFANVACLHACIDQLSDQDQTIVARRYVDGASVRQLASELGILPNAAKQRSFRARKRLRECVKRVGCGDNQEPEDLVDRECVPCFGGVPALSHEVVAQHMAQLDSNWHVSEQRHLVRHFSTDSFTASLAFVAALGALAKTEGHHPMLTARFDSVIVETWTDKVDDLTNNDLILAAKIDRLWTSNAWRTSAS